ncbi:uncharacterized protein LOC111695792 [Eurytemora carolleeae]|uniref:uncharacterized protein LOC111695792 n=1 Tax=Eurytemora carolleeae TaxID=1294199 RepID=UPI000C77A46A|nr:uncharacterized protein LOC111695792 [Eurytemora carolleeae]|eukprot:XP_023321001.1 uncharacterized protein LOC111695792 [Eurytemora affinis]
MNLTEKEEKEEKGKERVMKDDSLISSEGTAEERGDKKDELSEGIEENCRKDEEKKEEIISKLKNTPRKKSPPGRIVEGRVVTITQDREAQVIYFIREQGAHGVGGEDIFLHSSRIQGHLPLHSRYTLSY